MTGYRDARDERIARLEVENASLRRGALSAFDWIAFVLAAVGLVVMCGCAYVSIAFAAMYRDFGAVLPLASRIATRTWACPVAAIVPLCVLLSALVPRSPLATRRRAIVAAFALELVTIGVYAYALYAPLLAVASHVHG